VNVSDGMVNAACSAYLYQTCPVVPDAMRAALEAALAPFEVPPVALSNAEEIVHLRLGCGDCTSGNDQRIAWLAISRALKILVVAPAASAAPMNCDWTADDYQAAGEAIAACRSSICFDEARVALDAVKHRLVAQAAPVVEPLGPGERGMMASVRATLNARRDADGWSLYDSAVDGVLGIIDRRLPEPKEKSPGQVLYEATYGVDDVPDWGAAPLGIRNACDERAAAVLAVYGAPLDSPSPEAAR
jgi:hypothetical protein